MSRTVVIRVGPVDQARRELGADLATLQGGGRVQRRREIWFANLNDAVRTFSERRLTLLRLLCQKRPRSEGSLARLARRSVRSVATDLRALARVGLVEMVPAGKNLRPVAIYDRIHLAADIALARDAA